MAVESPEEHAGLPPEDDAPDGSVIATSVTLDSIRREWLALCDATPDATPFHRPEWHECWLRHFGARCEPVFLAFRAAEQLVGVAALDLAGGGARELGDPNVRDYAGPLALPGFESLVAETLLEWLAEDLTESVTLWGVREESPMRAALGPAAEALGWSYGEADEALAPAIALPASWDEYLARLSKHDRHELRRKLRNLEAAGVVSVALAAGEEAVNAGIDRLTVMMRASHDGKVAFLTPETEAFFRDLAATMDRAGLLRLETLHLDDAPVATLLMFDDAHTTYLYNSGYDPEYGRLAVGLLSKAIALRNSIGRGKHRFEFLRGDEDYKRRLGGGREQVMRASLTRR